MKSREDKFEKAFRLRDEGRIERDNRGVYFVPASIGGFHLVSCSGICSCPAFGICSHQLSTIYIDALVVVQLLRWADSKQWIDDTIELYKEKILGLPEHVRAMVREELQSAREQVGNIHQIGRAA